MDPGHYATGIMEAPDPSDTVAPSANILLRHRPGSVFGEGNGVFQPATSGKYIIASELTVPEYSSRFSTSTKNSESNRLQIYYQNVRGLRTKIDSFFLAVSEGEYDLIVITETWLDDRIFSTQLFGNRYTVFRNDRSPLTSSKTRGGGVLIAVSTNLNSRIDPAFIHNTVEQLWVIVETPCNDISVGVIYLPPDRKSDTRLVQQHIDSIESVLSRGNRQTQALLFGDYNQSGLRWFVSNNGLPRIDTISSQMPGYCCALLDGLSLHGMTQINTITNRDERMLDLVFANELALTNCAVSIPCEPIVALDSVHPAIAVSLFLPEPVVYVQPLENRVLNFRRADYFALSAALSDINWNDLLARSINIDDAVSSFCNAVHDVITLVVPECEPPRKPPWSNARLRTLKRLRSSSLRKYCCHRSPYYKNVFRNASSQYRNYNRHLYNRYVARIQENLRRNPKRFWSFVNEKRKENGLPSSMFLGNRSADNNGEKCDLFAEQFMQAFNSFVASFVQIGEASEAVPRDVFSFEMPLINTDTVVAGLRKLKTSYAAGPDGIPSAVLKHCSDVLCNPIAKLFNLSVRQCKFPDRWKFSFLFPIFKKGDKRDISNYRGITSMCACSKLFEIIVNDALFASCKYYIDEEQHGFYPKRSVTTNLMQFVSRCIQSLDSGLQTDAVYLDLKAAFDRVDHGILLAKMESLGVSSTAVRWFRSYLTDRNICVKIGSNVSECFSNKSGVPQGSNLGPLLFSIFINDISLLLPPGYRLFYADDTKIFNVIRSHRDCLELQKNMDIFFSWCSNNCLTLSIEKCNIITFHRTRSPLIFDYTIAGQCLSRVSCVKDLGVLLDSELTFKCHYNNIIARANRQLGFIFKISSEFRNPLCLKSLYCSLVRSILETNAVVWCPFHANWSARIEAIQKKFVRYALRYLPWRDPLNLPPYEDRCRLLGIQPLEFRRRAAQAVFAAKFLTNNIDCPSLLCLLFLLLTSQRTKQSLKKSSTNIFSSVCV